MSSIVLVVVLVLGLRLQGRFVLTPEVAGSRIDGEEEDDDELPCWLKEKGRLPRSGVGGRNRVAFVVVSFTVL